MNRTDLPPAGLPWLTAAVRLAARALGAPFALFDAVRAALAPRPRVRPPAVRACDPDEPADPRELCHAYGIEASARHLDWLATGDGPDPLDGEVAACMYGGVEGRCPYCVEHVAMQPHQRVARARS